MTTGDSDVTDVTSSITSQQDGFESVSSTTATSVSTAVLEVNVPTQLTVLTGSEVTGVLNRLDDAIHSDSSPEVPGATPVLTLPGEYFPGNGTVAQR